MQTLELTQASPEWSAARARHFCASEAPAMMGCSPYQTRSALLAQKHTGIAPEVDAATQRRFDDGHAAEAAFRPIAEAIIGDDLYPVTGTLTVDGLPLLASFDGLTMDGGMVFEHKVFNADTAEHIKAHGEPPIHHVWQLEHQLLVSGASQVFFATSNGTEGTATTCQYTSQPDRRAALIAGWKQFAADLAAYTPAAQQAPTPTGKAPDTLPALRIEVTGMVTASNLDEFKAAALAAIRGVNRELQTDQDFADAEQAVKWCFDVEGRIKAAKEHALSQTASIDRLFKALDDIAEESRRTRLDLSKLVTSQKDARKAEIVRRAADALRDFVAALNERIGRPLMPATVSADFAEAVKGKRSLANIQDAVDTELARVKIDASQIADRILINVRSIEAAARPELFHDMQSLVLKAPDDLAAIIAQRVAEADRLHAAKMEAERERIRAEVEAKERARIAAEERALARAEEERRRAEEEAMRHECAIDPTPAPVPAPVPVPAPAPVAASDDDAMLKLGDINARLHPITLSAEGLAMLGFAHVRQDKNAKLYRAADFPMICRALVRLIQSASGGAL